MTFPPLEPIDPWLRPGAVRAWDAMTTDANILALAPALLPERALLTLWNPDTEEAVIFDPPPKEVRTSAGTTTTEITLDEFGTLSRPTGRAPTSYSWSGVFYGARRLNTPLLVQARFKPPSEWRWLLEEFHRLQATRVHALELHLEGWDIPPFTKPVDIGTLEFAYRGGAGDLYYSINLVEHRHVQVGVVGATIGEGESVASDASVDTVEGEPNIPDTVMVQTGDTLWDVSQRYLGDGRRWTEVASLNNLTDEDCENLPIGMELALPGGVADAGDVESGSVSYAEIEGGE